MRGRHLAEQVALRDGNVRADALLTQHLLLCAAPRIPRTLILRSTDSCRGPAGARTGCPTSLACLVPTLKHALMAHMHFYLFLRKAAHVHRPTSSCLGCPVAFSTSLSSRPGDVCYAPRYGDPAAAQQGRMHARCMTHARFLCMIWIPPKRQGVSSLESAGVTSQRRALLGWDRPAS